MSHYKYDTLDVYCFFMFSFRSILDGIQYLVKCLFFLVSEFFGLYFCVNKLLFLKLDSGASSHQPAGHPASWTWDLPGWLKGRFLFFFFLFTTTHQSSLVALKCITGRLFLSSASLLLQAFLSLNSIYCCVNVPPARACVHRAASHNVLKERVPPHVSYKVIKLRIIAKWMW